MAGAAPTGLDAVDWAWRLAEYGAGEILLTSMDRDGTKAGFDIALTRAVADAVRVPVIASGGVGTLDHLVEGIRDGHATAVLAASIFHFGTFSHRRGQGTPRRAAACRCGPRMADSLGEVAGAAVAGHRIAPRRRPGHFLHRKAVLSRPGEDRAEARRGGGRGGDRGGARRRAPR